MSSFRFKSAAIFIAVFALTMPNTIAGKALVKRSDDVVDQLATEVQTLKASMAALQNSLTQTNSKVDRLDTNVAFLTGFNEYDVTGYHPETIVKFNNVRLNTGDGYSHDTGIFTAPVAGLYAFGLKIQSLAGRPQSLDLIHEGTGFGHVFGDDPDSFDMASTLELLHLNRGERVWVATGTQGNQFRGVMISHFLCFLLRAD